MIASVFKRGIVSKTSIWDKLVFHKFHEEIGGNIKLVVTGLSRRIRFSV